MNRTFNDGAANTPKPDFSPEVMERLFYWTRDYVSNLLAHTGTSEAFSLGEIGASPVLGAFVSFKKRGRLRSCMGYMHEGVALATALESAAVSATTRDPRFPPISSEEIDELELEVWVLGSMHEIKERGVSRRDVIKIGRDGIQIEGRGRRGLLLPSVPVELNWNVDEFLDGVCDKAGLARGSWADDDVSLFAFEGTSFKKPFVWNASKNPELTKLITERQNDVSETSNETRSASRPSFSLSSSLLHWQAPQASNLASRQDDWSQAVRKPAVAGMFYPGTAAEQKALLDQFDSTNSVEPDATCQKQNVSGALVPHAGWIYSGRLAAKTLSQIEEQDTVFVLAPKHRREGANFSVAPYEYWDFSAGKVQSNLEFVEGLVSAVPSFQKDPAAHRTEHSIEVQLPLIVRYFPKAKVVGVLIGSSSKNELTEIADQLANFLTKWEDEGNVKPLILISSDMNHYASDESTRVIDKIATDALETTDPESLFDAVMQNGITMCGVMPAFLALSALKRRGEFNSAIRVGYATSGDTSGDLERVVGYAGYLFK
jgi:AmmeMemoRadiSam system protein B/AmmeMemoRadiSam system protein A